MLRLRSRRLLFTNMSDQGSLRDHGQASNLKHIKYAFRTTTSATSAYIVPPPPTRVPLAPAPAPTRTPQEHHIVLPNGRQKSAQKRRLPKHATKMGPQHEGTDACKLDSSHGRHSVVFKFWTMPARDNISPSIQDTKHVTLPCSEANYNNLTRRARGLVVDITL